ncbi:MAG: prepilin cleavage protein [Myxococcaceae bacterium]
MTLVEGLAATAILMIGLMGTLPGLWFATQQNAMADRMARASAIAGRARQSMFHQGQAALRQSAPAGLLDASRCDPALGTGQTGADTNLVGDLSTVLPAPCFVDLDLFESAPPDPTMQLMLNYSAEDQRTFRRVLAYFDADPNMTSVAVVVSWRENNVRRYHQQFTGFYNPASNSAGWDNNL